MKHFILVGVSDPFEGFARDQRCILCGGNEGQSVIVLLGPGDSPEDRALCRAGAPYFSRGVLAHRECLPPYVTMGDNGPCVESEGT
ncbi:MAG: hypothetical protein WC700_09125 [Gemmatimonadaceae bacterium]|jgi:hypothetical protein